MDLLPVIELEIELRIICPDLLLSKDRAGHLTEDSIYPLLPMNFFQQDSEPG
jgi:hypothetical protein